MALSLIEINNVKKGVVKPENITLLNLVTLSAQRNAQWFYNNPKETDDGSVAQRYHIKKYSLANRVTNGDSNAYKALWDMVILLAGNIVDYTDLESYTDAQWSDLADNNIANAFDFVGGMTIPERNAYNAL